MRTSLEHLEQQSTWRTKVLEKPGTALFRKFMISIAMVEGCERGPVCIMCNNDGIGCSSKNIVYSARCLVCEQENEKTKWQEEHSNDSIWHVGDNSLEDNGEAENLAEPTHEGSNFFI